MTASLRIDLSLSPELLAEVLRQRLAQPLPGAPAQRHLAPELAYGRHGGPPALDARQAAVIVLLYPQQRDWYVPAMLRPADMKDHAGQVALPGGVVEPGETPQETALRELEEELGTPRAGVSLIGPLTALYVFNSNFLVRPFLAVMTCRPEFCLNPREAAELVEIPMTTLLDPAQRGTHCIERRDLVFVAPHYQVGPHQVWGATSMILAELGAILGGE